jgi:hypothetical protein
VIEQKESATTANSGGECLGLCVNCEHAALDHTSEPCKFCHNARGIFTNFSKAKDKQESQKCNTCRNNTELPREKGTPINQQGFPCNVCVDEYFYHSKID